MPTKQHGQIRGYQVHYVRMVNGEPTGQPVIKDILIDDAQVQHPPHSNLCLADGEYEAYWDRNVLLAKKNKIIVCIFSKAMTSALYISCLIFFPYPSIKISGSMMIQLTM